MKLDLRAGKPAGMRSALESKGYATCGVCGTMTRAAEHCGNRVTGKAPGSLASAQAPVSRPTVPQTPPGAPLAHPGRTGKAPNRTEAEYKRRFIDFRLASGELTACWFEGLAFRMANGHRYTPDWVCCNAAGKFSCVEVKGPYRFGSHQRARLAFDQARIEYPAVAWVWATRQKGGEWQTAKP